MFWDEARHTDAVSESELDQSPSEHNETDTAADLEVSNEAAAAEDDAEAPSRESPFKRLDKGLLTAYFVIACGLFAIIWAVTSAITGTDGIDRPDAIERLSPVENAQQVVQQEQVVVDLQFGYEAALVIDGIELPTARIGEFVGDLDPENAGVQVEAPPTAVFDPGNARIEFRPGRDALIESFSEGRHEVQVIYWKVEEGRANALSYRWSFDVV